jgi:hypothetical protein
MKEVRFEIEGWSFDSNNEQRSKKIQDLFWQNVSNHEEGNAPGGTKCDMGQWSVENFRNPQERITAPAG